MKYWHYLVFYILVGIIVFIDIRGVSYKEDCIRYGQPRVCLIDEPPARISAGGKGGYSYHAIGFTLEYQGRITKENNSLYGRRRCRMEPQGMASIDVTPLTSAC